MVQVGKTMLPGVFFALFLVGLLAPSHSFAERIRLNGIDCPEKGQAYGTKAKQAVSNLVFGKAVTVETLGLDKYGHALAVVSLPDGINVNLEMVRNGWCWWYPEYAPENVILAELQRRARRAGVGLWADPNPVPPWEWRRRNKSPPY